MCLRQGSIDQRGLVLDQREVLDRMAAQTIVAILFVFVTLVVAGGAVAFALRYQGDQTEL